MIGQLRLSVSLVLLLSACASAITPTSSPTPPATNTPFPTPTLVSKSELSPLQILFIGNSHTFMNDLPNTFAGLARSGGHEVDVDSSVKGGYTLEDHTTDRDTLEELDGANWDFVILQENSNIPRSRSDMRERMAPAARALDGRIKKAGAQTVLFVTWASLDMLAGSGIEGFVDEQEQVSAGFLAIAEELDATIAPVGAAWARSLTQRPDLDLWQYDNIHANRNGIYLAACVFYAVIYGQSPSGLDYTAGLPGDTAQFLQRVAAEVVLADSAISLPTRQTRLYCSADPFSCCHHPRDDQFLSSLISLGISGLMPSHPRRLALSGLYLIGRLSHSSIVQVGAAALPSHQG